jgi:hypothetical protein
MGHPVLLLVSDQESVLRALAADLAIRYSDDHRIVAKGSAAAALATLERLAARSEAVALVVAAQQMDGMTSVELLTRDPSGGARDDAGADRRLPVRAVAADWSAGCTCRSAASWPTGCRCTGRRSWASAFVGLRWRTHGHELRETLTSMGIVRDRERDLHLRSAQPSPPEPVVDLPGQGYPDRCRRRIHPALGQSQQGQAGLSVPAKLVGSHECVLCPGQVTAD